MSRSRLATLLSVLPLLSAAAPAQETRALPFEDTAGWAVIAGARVKPFETFAIETARAIAGRAVQTDGVGPLELVWGFALAPDEFAGRPFVRVEGAELKQRLGLDASQRRFSLTELEGKPDLKQLAFAGWSKERAEQPAEVVERQAGQVYDRVQRLQSLSMGEVLEIVPIAGEAGHWMSLMALRSSTDPALAPLRDGFARLAEAFRGKDAEAFAAAAAALGPALRAAGPELYPSDVMLARELTYNSLNLFGKAWVCYLLGFLLLAFTTRVEAKLPRRLGLALVGLGLFGHTAGIALRWAIAGRAPVSDMYESLVFMGWGVIAFGLVLESFYRKGYFGTTAGLLGFLALVFAEKLPLSMFDPAIDPLKPVLANTSWLSIHVMTIMLSYSAFALATGIGHYVMFVQFRNPGRTQQLRTLATLLYKTLQVGVLFLAAGIAFGAIWANESWGRYWGWDPKETWSLITFFIYMVLIHARFAGWIRHFGLAALSVLAFVSVVMTYYGVNFLLGAGLHSYGSGSGGTIFFAIFLAVELAILGLGYWAWASGKIQPVAD